MNEELTALMKQAECLDEKKQSKLVSSPMSTMCRWPRCWVELLGFAHHVDFNQAVSGAMRLSALRTG